MSTALWQVSSDGRRWYGAVELEPGPEDRYEMDIYRTAVLTKGRGQLLVKFWRFLPSVVTSTCHHCGALC